MSATIRFSDVERCGVRALANLAARTLGADNSGLKAIDAGAAWVALLSKGQPVVQVFDADGRAVGRVKFRIEGRGNLARIRAYRV